MNPAHTSPSSGEPPDHQQLIQINRICNRFERAWKSGEPLSIEAAAAGVETAIRSALIQHLAELDIEYRIARGEQVQLESYLARWPNLNEAVLREVLNAALAHTKTSLTLPGQSASAETVTRKQKPPCTLAEFVSRLRGTGILTEQETLSVTSALPKDVSVRDLQRRFVKAGLLTNWQCETIESGGDDPLILGEYVLEEQIGKGGMGTVYRARHRKMKRQVAVKILRRDIANAEMLAKRFLREVEVAARLSHPNIVTAFDAGEVRGISYLVTELVDGQNLSDLVRQYGPLSLNVALDVIQQAARALAYAHREGIIHRDIKPSNLLIDDAGNVKLLDVGLARINQPDEQQAASESDLTTTGMVMGTPDYMSPEQALNTRLASEPSDVYSLGCTLHFLITGRPPYARGTTMERLLAHREQPIPSLRNLNHGIPVSVDLLLTSMLAKSPEQRLSSMQSLVQQIEQIRSGGVPDITLPLDAATDEPVVESPVPATTLPGGPVPAQPRVRKGEKQRRRSEATQPAMNPTIAPVQPRPAKVRRKAKQKRGLWLGGAIGAVIAVITLIVYINSDRGGSNEVQSGNGNATVPQGSSSESATLPEFQNLSDLSETAVQQYRTEWADRLGLPMATVVDGIQVELIPPGEFLYGAPDSASVQRITQPFYLSSAEITVGQYRRFVNARRWQTTAEREGTGWGVNNQSGTWARGSGYSWQSLGGQTMAENLPAVNLAYPDVIAFCEWLTTASGRRVRLPTEQEWEYACRTGRNVSWSFGNSSAGIDEYAWTNQNSGLRLNEVRRKRPSAWGLYDMHGNESEWCFSETAAGSEFAGDGIVRGGGFATGVDGTRCWVRASNPLRSPTHGAFRVVIEIPQN